MKSQKYNTTTRQILLYQIMLSQLPLKRQDLMREFSISSRTLDRDISSIRNILAEMSTFSYNLPQYTLILDPEINKCASHMSTPLPLILEGN